MAALPLLVEVARRREARWMQEARDRRQWLAQARWLEELWRVAFGGPIWRRGEDTTVPRSTVLPSLRTFYQKITDNVLLL